MGERLDEQERVPLEELDLGEEESPEDKPPKFGWLDVLAFTIAAYQIIFPIVFVFFGVVLLLYLLLRLFGS